MKLYTVTLSTGQAVRSRDSQLLTMPLKTARATIRQLEAYGLAAAIREA